jgi:hypothetical protein
VTGRVASHTSIQVSTQQAGLHALDFPEPFNDRMRKQAR